MYGFGRDSSVSQEQTTITNWTGMHRFMIGATPRRSLPLLLLLWLCIFHPCGSNTWGIKCGWATVNPQTTLCCSGLVYVRSGINPACCGSVAYDAFYSYCCDGRIRRKSNFGRCCGTRTYDARSSTCQEGGIRTRQRAGSTCCVRNNLRQCCRQGGGCCSTSSSSSSSYPGSSSSSSSSSSSAETGSSIAIPGFRPACCAVASSVGKAQCCSAVTQKAGVMPSCCDTKRHRPTCCRTSVTSFMCCHSVTYGAPLCCRSDVSREDYYPYRPQPTTTTTTTPYPHHLVPVHPTPLPEGGSCCFRPRPTASCCRALQPEQTQYPVVPAGRETRCCTFRISCCSIRDYGRYGRCCRGRSTSGPGPLCCSTSYRNNYLLPTTTTTTTLPPEHRCYSCRLNGGHDYNKNPPVLARPLGNTNVGANTGGARQENTGSDGGPGWARLSCCNSGYLKQCCRNALRLAGVYADCCTAQVIADSATSRSNSHQSYNNNYNNIYNYQQPQQQRQQPQQQPYFREAICNNRPYDVTYYMCCFGVVRLKRGLRPACCGSKPFDASTEKCCSDGYVKRTCVTSRRSYRYLR